MFVTAEEQVDTSNLILIDLEACHLGSVHAEPAGVTSICLFSRYTSVLVPVREESQSLMRLDNGSASAPLSHASVDV